MASPHWKPPNNHDNATFGPSIGGRNSSSSSFFSSPRDSRRQSSPPPMGTFNSASLSSTGGNSDPSSSPANAGGFREAGIVEKLLPSYGFIQCCERQARLFFHYSQFKGNIDHLKLGDPVEFEMTYDRRTGKPIASYVMKISSEALLHEELSSERASGFITTEITSDSREGRVAYESRGECFFLPFTKDDVEDSQGLRAKDRVTFLIASDKSGNLRARRLTLETPTPERFQGVICTLKDSFGFIERADVVREIFFHSSEAKDFKSLTLGDDVEFSVQSRNDKEVAANVTQLPAGSVVFEDVSDERYTGQVLKTCERINGHSRQQLGSSTSNGNEPFPGKIRYKKMGMESETSFGERDVKGEYTIQSGDIVTFSIVTDRRDKLKHATNIELSEKTFEDSGEHREQGYIASIRDSYGFIKCLNREGTRVYFRLAEMLDANTPVKLNDEVDFTVSPDHASPGRLQAIRIKFVPNGTLMKNLLTARPREQLQNSPYANGSSESSHFQSDAPLIDLNSELPLSPASNSSASLEQGYGSQRPVRTDSWSEILSHIQIPISSVESNEPATNFGKGESSSYTNKNERSSQMNGLKTARGFIAALKESYGFIENEDHQTEVFFHYSVYESDINAADLGTEVEYTATVKGSKLSAEHVRKLPSGTLLRETVLPDQFTGVITRSVRCLNPEQDGYPGFVKTSGGVGDTVTNGALEEYEFGITGLADIHDFVQKGDEVTFQVGICKKTGQKRAVNIKPVRSKHRATVDAIKGNFGFLNFDVDGGKKLFFHMSEVKGENTSLYPGDSVEFQIVHNQRNGKSSACSIEKATGEAPNSQRPDRLITKMRSLIVNNDAPRIVLVRQPRGPDGTTGFAERKPSV